MWLWRHLVRCRHIFLFVIKNTFFWFMYKNLKNECVSVYSVINSISFTLKGGLIGREVAPHHLLVLLELGGKSPLIIFLFYHNWAGSHPSSSSCFIIIGWEVTPHHLLVLLELGGKSPLIIFLFYYNWAGSPPSSSSCFIIIGREVTPHHLLVLS